MSTTTNLALNEPAYNSTSPTWDQPLNYNATILDQMYGNTTSVAVSTSGSTTYTNITAPSATAAGSTSQAMRFNLTGALAANQNVLLPQSVAGMWVVSNNTTNAFTVTLGSNNGSNVAAGTTVACPQGYSILVYCDGTNVKKADDGLISSGIVTSFSAGTTGLTPSTATTGAVTLAGTLNVANGGTGAATLTANNVILGNGISAVQVVAPGTSGNVLTSDGTTWSSSAATKAIGNSSQTWQAVTRTSGTTYTNSTGAGIMVTINPVYSSGSQSIIVVVGGVQIYNFGNGGGGYISGCSFIVPAGATYVLTYTLSTATISELR